MTRIALACLLVACGSNTTPQPPDDPPADGGVEATCEGVPLAGTCTSSSELARCVDGVVQTETCATGCVQNGDGAECAVLDCGTVGPLGRCAGEILARCDAAPSLTDCAASGQACAYVDDTTGYGCVDPATLPAKRVSGMIRWEDRPLEPGVLGAPVAMPARGAMVAVLDDATDATLATVSAADDGSYVAYYAPAANVRVVAYSRSRAAQRPARVRDTAGYLHALGSDPFAPDERSEVDILVSATSPASGAWNALDNAIVAMDWLRARGVTQIVPVFMYWQRTTSSGSYYQGGDNSLHLDGDDGFDDVVALHELGHYMQDEYSASDNPGGSHDGSPADPRLAWGEGGATWFAIAVRGVPYYIDYSAGGGWSVELEDRVHAANPAAPMSQRISEWMVAEFLFDLGDAGGEDPVAGEQPRVWDVFAGYVREPQPRGFTGVDLVEFLDGWFVHHGTSSCTAVGALAEQYGFPYDFNGPTSCP